MGRPCTCRAETALVFSLIMFISYSSVSAIAAPRALLQWRSDGVGLTDWLLGSAAGAPPWGDGSTEMRVQGRGKALFQL
jgi:hypothetical protein